MTDSETLYYNLRIAIRVGTFEPFFFSTRRGFDFAEFIILSLCPVPFVSLLCTSSCFIIYFHSNVTSGKRFPYSCYLLLCPLWWLSRRPDQHFRFSEYTTSRDQGSINKIFNRIVICHV